MNVQGLVPHLVVKGGAAAVDFYKAALGAVEVLRMPDPGGSGKLLHAHLKVGGSDLFLCDDFPEHCGGVSRAATGASPVTFHLSVPNADAAISQAAAAGTTVTMPAADMFWGDRYGQVVDPFGHTWSFAHPLAKQETQAA